MECASREAFAAQAAVEFAARLRGDDDELGLDNPTAWVYSLHMNNVAIEKDWDGNERVHESRNGRTYVSAGRWQWVVLVNGVVDQAFDTKREARERVEHLQTVGR